MRKRTALLAAGIQLLSISAALAQTMAGEPVPDGREWLKCPATASKNMRYYPDKALRAEIEGVVKIQCRFELSGKASECVWLTGPVADMGFGKAAERLGCLFKMKDISLQPNGELPVKVIPINFKVPR